MWLSGAYLSRAAQREISNSSLSVAISPLERKVGSSSSGQHHRHHQVALLLQWEQDPFPPDLAPSPQSSGSTGPDLITWRLLPSAFGKELIVGLVRGWKWRNGNEL